MGKLIASLIPSLSKLDSQELEKLLNQRAAEDKAIRALWRAAIARERAERRQKREADELSAARKAVAR